MRLTPEVVLLGDHTMSRVRWTLELETQRIQQSADESPEFADLMMVNGWTARSIAWGHVIAGLMDACGFDDEEGRT